MPGIIDKLKNKSRTAINKMEAKPKAKKPYAGASNKSTRVNRGNSSDTLSRADAAKVRARLAKKR